MAVFQFSALSDGQAISFNPNADVLNFDQLNIAAADLGLRQEGSNTRVVVQFGPQTGKDIVLLNTTTPQFSTTNMTFADGSRVLFGDNSAATLNDNVGNVLSGGNGRDLINGFGGADTISGGLGNDRIVAGAGDVLSDAGGTDTVLAEVDWTLADGFENLEIIGSGNLSATGNNGTNVLIGNSGNNFFNPRGGNDTISGGTGNDFVRLGGGGVTSYGSKLIDLGAGFDALDFGGLARSAIVVDLAAGTLSGGGDAGTGNATLSGIEQVIGDGFNDRLSGSAAAESLNGGAGNDTINGRGGNDTLTGGLGADTFAFSTAPGTGNVEQVTDFVSATDKLSFDNAVFAALGAAGNFSAGDARFVSGAGLTSGQDASDRLVYNTTTRELFYDADGNGAGASQLVATLQGAPMLAATDIVVTGQAQPPAQGTAGNDSLTGTGINDSLAGLEGDDTLRGLGGNDTLDGGPGNDRLDGGPNTQELDTLNGALGNDTYELWEVANDLISDAGGVDTILAHGGTTWILPTAVENLVLTDVNGFSSVGDAQLTGNELNNVIRNEDNSSQPGRTAFMDGADGNDTLIGGTGQDHFLFAAGSGSYGNDSVDGGVWIDDLVVGRYSAAVVDFRAGTVVGGGTGGSGSVHFTNIEAAFGGAFDDRLIANDSGVELFGGNGSDTMLGGAGDDVLWQNDFLQPFFSASDAGNDQIFGGAGNDRISGWRGNNLMDGGAGDDEFLLDGVQGRWGADTITGGEGADEILLLGQRGAIVVDLSSNSFTDGGPGSLTFSGVENFTEGSGANFDDHIIGSAGPNRLAAMLGNDLLEGGAGDDTLIGAGLDDFDPVGGNNTLDGGLGADSLVGTREIDNFLFRAPNTGVDRVTSFATFQDKLLFDNTGFTAIGGLGTFASGDARFFAGAGATAGQDANDRIVYDTSTGNLYYDADGSGGGAAQLIATLEGRPGLTATNIVVVGSGEPAGGAIVGTEGPDTLTGTEGNDSISGLAGNDAINALAGDDTLDGGAGIDTMNGGLGNDTYIVTSGDVLSDPGGIDTVQSAIDWSLADGLENLTLTGTGNVSATGNNGRNLLIGNSGNNFFNPRAGDDTIQGGAGNDLVRLGGGGTATYGNKLIDGGAGFDGLDFGGLAKGAVTVDLARQALACDREGGVDTSVLIGFEQIIADGFNDRLTGSAAAESLNGGGGNDTVDGGGGNDTLTGGVGADTFGFTAAPGAANADLVTDFASAGDKLSFDSAMFSALGTPGNFAAGDARFVSGAGFTSGRDASDRVIYNTTTGQLFFDADGNGAGAAQLVATLQDAPALSATDIFVTGTFQPNPTQGTAADDSLRGTEGNDSIAGLAGNDTINGLGGDDTLVGGSGTDVLVGGAGNDEYFVDAPGDTVIENAGSGADFVFSFVTYTLSANVETMTLGGNAPINGTGNVLNNLITGNATSNLLAGGDGNDTLNGGAGIDTLDGGLGDDFYVVTAGDVLFDSGGVDWVLTEVDWALGPDFENLVAAGGTSVTITGNNGTNSLAGNGSSNFINPRGGDDTIQGGAGNDFVRLGGGGVSTYGSKLIDLGAGFDGLDFGGLARSALVVDLAAGTLSGGGDAGTGNATLVSIEQVIGDGFNDQLSGGAAAESLNGGGGNDTINGRGGNDTLTGGLGADAFVFATAPGTGNTELVTDFVSATDKLSFDNAFFTALGADGNFVAGDARFAAGAGFTSGRDASDRLVYNTTLGQLFYDADGSGAGAAQLVATFQGHPAITATDITVI